MVLLLLVFAVVGAVAGFIAGLFGLGGGVVIVPVLIYTFAALAFPISIATHLAVGTSLAAIVITSSVSSWTHWQKQAIDLNLLKQMIPGVILGAWLGGEVASWLAGEELQMTFALFLMFVALTLLFSVKENLLPLPGPWGMRFSAVMVGALSSLFGIGGGSITVPFLRLCGVVMSRAVATSAALGLPIAIAGVVAYVYQGWNASDLPPGSFGFVYLPAFLGMVVCSAPASRVGAKLAHRLPAHKLQRAFGVVLLLIAVEMIVSVLW